MTTKATKPSGLIRPSLYHVLLLMLGVWLVVYFRSLKTVVTKVCEFGEVLLSPDAEWLARRCDGGVSLYELATGKCAFVARCENLNFPQWNMSFSPGTKRFAFTTRSCTRVFDLHSRTELHPIQHEHDLPWFLSWTSDGQILVLVSYDRIESWSVPEQRRLSRIDYKRGGVVSIALSPTDGLLATTVHDPGPLEYSVVVDNVTRAEIVRQTLGKGQPQQLLFSPDGTLLTAVSRIDHLTRVWSIPDGIEERTFKFRNPMIAAFSQNGRWFGLAFGDLYLGKGQVVICEPTGEVRHQFPITDASSLSLGVDGQLLTTASRNGTVSVWDVKTGKVLRQLAGLRIWSVSISHGMLLGLAGVVWAGLWYRSRPGRDQIVAWQVLKRADHGWSLIAFLAVFELATGLMLMCPTEWSWFVAIVLQPAVLILILLSLFWIRINLLSLTFAIAMLVAVPRFLWNLFVSLISG